MRVVIVYQSLFGNRGVSKSRRRISQIGALMSTEAHRSGRTVVRRPHDAGRSGHQAAPVVQRGKAGPT